MIAKLYNNTIKKLYNWTMSLSKRKNAIWILAGFSFVGSSFFPIPPDLIQIPLILANRKKAFWIATVTTVSSVAGALFGYFIGACLFDIIAEPLLNFYGYMDAFEKFRGQYNEYGAWIVFIFGVTPFPYKVVTIASGATGLSIPVFIISSFLARGLRFGFTAWLLYKWGQPMKEYIEKNLGWLSILFCVILIGGFWALKYFN